MNDLIKRHLGEMTASQRQATLRQWAEAPLFRYLLINLAGLAALIGTYYVPWSAEGWMGSWLHAGRTAGYCFVAFNGVSLLVFGHLRKYARGQLRYRNRGKSPRPAVTKG